MLPKRLRPFIGILSVLTGLVSIGHAVITVLLVHGMVQDSNDLQHALQLIELLRRKLGGIVENPFAPMHAALGTCLFIYLALVLAGIQIARERYRWSYVLLAVVAIEATAFGLSFAPMDWFRSLFAGDFLFLLSNLLHGGLIWQGVTLFPIWGPAIALWVIYKRRRDRRRGATTDAGCL